MKNTSIKKIIVLQGGEDVAARANKTLFEQILALSKTKNILVIPWTTSDSRKEKKYRKIISNYFREVGFKKIFFLEKSDSDQNIREKFSKVDVVYLPGGDPSILYEEIKKRRLVETKLREFEGIIIGNSAGAIVLSKGTYYDNRFQPGLGLVDFFIKVHFNLTSQTISKPSLCIPENQWVVIVM
ncbi:MAG: hypothetical protein DRJ52_03555 [Thermoprotei archaeon]|nr:MAG: hypothetical protein DRJ52_03555 [Thermoprotei archaeon]RLE98986.1 MAG: hypothetical protein DRJ63_06635 [Thermoprotei archaeon]HDI75594.1 hypothetical protein [Thermoprotei archaeon]